MTINRELFGQIADQIEREPQFHNQDTWEGTNAHCGTTRCVAGWAIFLAEGRESLRYQMNAADGDVFEKAMDLLGLDDQSASDLFYNFNNYSALQMVRAYADGREVTE